MSSFLQTLKRRLYHTFSASKEPLFDCPVCRTRHVPMGPLPQHFHDEYKQHGFLYALTDFETLNLQHFNCRHCGASDRDRLYALYLRDYLKNKTSVKLLDIAPAKLLAQFIRSFPQVNYRSTDLYMPDVDDQLDITNMHAYTEGQFDFFICSHVLEHIPDDRKAMQELYRILAKGGKGIAMVPIHKSLPKTHENPSFSVADRWKYFGQDDHVRLYSKTDFVERLTATGFQVEQLGKNHFGAEVFAKHGIADSSILYIVTK